METLLYVTEIMIGSVRHLKNIRIPVSDNKLKHVVLTGRNGSGKTSVLDAIASFMDNITATEYICSAVRVLESHANLAQSMRNMKSSNMEDIDKKVIDAEKKLKDLKGDIDIKLNYSIFEINNMYKSGNFVLAYYKSDRVFSAEVPKHVEKVELKDSYSINEKPRENFVKYLLDLKMTEALSLTSGKKEKADLIKSWFENFDEMLQKIFGDNSVHLEFDEETFLFHISQKGKESFDFNTLSSGYAAILDIVADIIIRMEKRKEKSFLFDMPGIVLIDEVENHLHLELQKRILQLLTTIFPNVQFIISTHSPFILNSLDNMVIYDLEKALLINNGLTEIPYNGIVEGFFQADTLSDSLKQKYERYKQLVVKPDLSDTEIEEIAKLEMYLDEIPDYLALNITTEYQKFKMDFLNREDL